jgi:hypothetical protein
VSLIIHFQLDLLYSTWTVLVSSCKRKTLRLFCWKSCTHTCLQLSLQNLTLGILIAEAWWTGLLSNQAKVFSRHRAKGYMALRWQQQCWVRSLRATGQNPIVCTLSIHMGLCGQWLFNDPVLVGLIWTTRNLQEKSGESHQTEPCNTGSSIDQLICGRCHMATETTSHILYECVALAEFRFCHVNTFMEPSNYQEIPSWYFTLSELQDYWWNKVNGDTQQITKWSWCKGHLVHPFYSYSCLQHTQLIKY